MKAISVTIPSSIPGNSGFDIIVDNYYTNNTPITITFRDSNYGHGFIAGNWWKSSNNTLKIQTFHVQSETWLNNQGNRQLGLIFFY